MPSALQHRNYSMNWVPVEVFAGLVPLAGLIGTGD